MPSSPRVPAQPSQLPRPPSRAPRGAQPDVGSNSVANERAEPHGQPAQEAQHGTIRFRPADDILILRQLVADRPWAAGRGSQLAAFDQVAVRLSDTVPRFREHRVDGRSIYYRFGALVKAFKQSEMELLRKSGTEVEYDEREQLLMEIVQLLDETQRQRHDVTAKERRRRAREDDAAGRMLDVAMGRVQVSSAQAEGVDDDIDDATDSQTGDDENRPPGSEARPKDMKRRRLSSAALVKALEPSREERQLLSALTNSLQALATPATRPGINAQQSDLQALSTRVESMEATMTEIKLMMLRQALGAGIGAA